MRNIDLTLKSHDGPDSINASFDAKKILFLVSSSGGLRLANEIAGGEIVYVIFSLNKHKIFAAPVNHAAAIDSRAKSGAISPGMSISVGLKKYVVGKSHREKSGWAWFAAAILAAAAVFAAVHAFTSSPKNAGTDNAPAAKIEIAPGDGRLIDGLLGEARAFLRAGDISQAKLSLIAANEKASGDLRVQKLMLELDEIASPAEVEEETDLRADKAGEFFKEGQRFAGIGDRFEAKKFFDKAHDLLGGRLPALPFASALEDARKQNSEMLEFEIRPKLLQISESVGAALRMDPAPAMKKLKGASEELFKITNAMPGDSGAATLKKNLDKNVKAIASKWIASARTAERLSGCARALAMYEAISSVFGDMEPAVSRDAAESALACRRPSN